MLRPLREQGKRAKEIVATSYYYYYYHVSIIKKEVGLKTYRRYRKKSGGKACHRISIIMVCRHCHGSKLSQLWSWQGHKHWKQRCRKRLSFIMLAGRAKEWKPTAEELGLELMREGYAAIARSLQCSRDKLLPQHCLYRRHRNTVIERRNGQGDGSPRKVQDTISKEWK